MKNLGKIFFFLVAVACSNSLFSQAFGVRAGLNLANMTFDSDSEGSDDFDTDMLIGLNLGVGLVTLSSRSRDLVDFTCTKASLKLLP